MSKIPAQLGKRATPASDTYFNENILKNRPEKMQDYNTLESLWSYHRSNKGTLENLETNNYLEFKSRIKQFNIQDELFSKQIDLLHKLVKNRKGEINFQMIRRYGKLMNSLEQ